MNQKARNRNISDKDDDARHSKNGNKHEQVPRYRKPPKAVKSPGPRPDYTPNHKREQLREVQASREERNRKAAEYLRELQNAAVKAASFYANFVLGVTGDYTVYEDLGYDFDVHDFRVMRQHDSLVIAGHNRDGGVCIPHEWLYTREEDIRFRFGQLGVTQKAMHAFLIRVMREEIEDKRSAWEGRTDTFERVAAAFGSTITAIEKPAVSLATSDGKRVDEESTPDTSSASKPATSAKWMKAVSIAEFMIGQSVGKCQMRDGRHMMVISQGIRDKKMRSRVESIDPKHILADQGVIVGTVISARLIEDEKAIVALRGNHAHPGTAQKLALAAFVREKLLARKSHTAAPIPEVRQAA